MPSAGVAAQPDGVAIQTLGGEKSNGIEAQDWEREIEEGVYAGYVERLQANADRDVTRTMKVSREIFLGYSSPKCAELLQTPMPSDDGT